MPDAVVNTRLFHREIIALQVELFALTWLHHLKEDKYTLPQSFFTKKYLYENGHDAIWDLMEDYNRTIAVSTKEIHTNERQRKAWIARVDLYKFAWATKWIEQVGEDAPDKECAGRIANRFYSEQAWKQKVTLQMLGSTLAMRLGCNANTKPEAVFQLQVIAYGFYNGAKQAIQEAKIG